MIKLEEQLKNIILKNVDFQIDVPSDVKFGTRSITITNPDGQSFTFADCLNIIPD